MTFGAFISRGRERARQLTPLLIVVVPIIVIAVVATQLAQLPAARAAVSQIQEAADAWWAVPLFVVLYVTFTIFLLPVGPLAVAAALAWGWKFAGTIEIFTCTVAAIVPYVLAQRGLMTWVERRVARARVPALDSPFVLFLLRLVPVVPFVAMNYIAGAMRVRFRDYVVTTFVGSIPSVFLFVWFVDTVAAGALGVAAQAKIVAACVVVAIAAIAARLVAARLARRE